MQSAPALTQLLHDGRAPSQRIFLVRHLWQAVTTFFFALADDGLGPAGVDNADVDAERDRLNDGPKDDGECNGCCCGGHPVPTPLKAPCCDIPLSG